VRKEQVSLALSKDLIKLIDRRKGRASRSAEVEYLIKLGLEHEREKEVNAQDE
jgi:metal-responsive CopG/Arc/MetJ family transcriptional regulator